jgi:hypothetical protein
MLDLFDPDIDGKPSPCRGGLRNFRADFGLLRIRKRGLLNVLAAKTKTRAVETRVQRFMTCTS